MYYYKITLAIQAQASESASSGEIVLFYITKSILGATTVMIEGSHLLQLCSVPLEQQKGSQNHIHLVVQHIE